ncbi:MAG: aminotransferase DegT, partial [Thermotogae bacterium]
MEIFLDAPNFGNLEKEYILNCIDSTYVSTAGPFVPEFEEKFANYVGTKKAVSVQSGTAALHMALHELGIGP